MSWTGPTEEWAQVGVSLNPAAAAPSTITVSGTLYADEGTTATSTQGKTIIVVVATSTPGVYATTSCATCTNSTWKITNVGQPPIGVPVLAFVDNDSFFSCLWISYSVAHS